MKVLTEIKENIFTTKLYEVIYSECPDIDTIKSQNVFLVMEHMQFDLKQIIEKNPFTRNESEDHLVTIFYNVLCALNFLHNLNLMHRDLKPENILVNEDCSIKLCDFSFTRTLHSCHREEETMSNSSAGFLSVSSSSST